MLARWIRTPTFKSAIWSDLLAFVLILLLVLGLLRFFEVGSAAFVAQAPIQTEIAALPGYAILSFIRSIIALFLSYTFAITYASIATKNAHTEKFMIPILDALQSLPVLAFLPGTVLTLIALFDETRWGLELACILMIATGQVWNLVYAYYESRKSLPSQFREVARLAHMTAAQRFFMLDLPHGLRPLVYNGMMSMAGGWFFLTLCESFTLNQQKFRLPGLGSYLAAAVEQQNYTHFWAGIACSCVMILGSQFLIWEPLIAWSAKYEDRDSDGKKETSWFLEVLKDANLISKLSTWMNHIVAKSFFKNERMISQRLDNLFIRAGIDVYRIEKASLDGTQRRAKLKQHLQRKKTFQFVRRGLALLLGIGFLYFLLTLDAVTNFFVYIPWHDWTELFLKLVLSTLKIATALFFATLWTLPVGFWIGRNVKVAKFILPIIQTVASFPAPVFFPFIAMILWQNHTPAYFITVILHMIGNQWYLLFNVISGTTRIPAELESVAQVCHLKFFQKWKQFYFPALLPSLATGLITAVGGCWNTSIVAELIETPMGQISSHGIGAEITMATIHGQYPRLVAAILVITFCIILLNRFLWHPLHKYIDKLSST